MSLKCLAAALILFVHCLSAPAISSQTKNRVAVSEADKIKLYEYNTSSQKFDLVWESVEASLNSRLGSPMQDLHIVDIDNDSKCELIAVDQYGIFVWGKNGKYPQYFPLQGTLIKSRYNYITAVDIDDDSTMEILTQRKNSEGTRRITVWKFSSNRLAPLNEIDLPGDISWSLRHGDFDGDGKYEILTSSNLIHILGWKDGEGLVIEAEIPNLAKLIDVVRPGDIDGDGVDEIIASGNSGCFSVYKHRKIYDRDFYPLYFQSLANLREKPVYSQGLHFGDIDGDNIKEILVGMTSRRGAKNDNILIYRGHFSYEGPESPFQFEKVFSMPLESSRIPGFVIGDLDNDGQNEVIYNRKFVLKFHRDVDGSISSESMGEISKRWANGVAIGPFYPSGEDEPQGLRLNPVAITVDLAGSEFFMPDETYPVSVKLKTSWHDVSQIRVELESDSNVAIIEPKSIIFNSIDAGQEVENTEQPFILRTKYVKKLTPFELKLVIETENGIRIVRKGVALQSKSNPDLFPFVRPMLTKESKTIAISGEEGIYKELGINPEYFNDYYGVYWPSSDDLNSYKNLIMYDELSYALFFHQAKLKSFLDNGGNCLMHGYNMISKKEDPVPPHMKEYSDFITTYLHVNYLDETNQVNELKGQPGDVITDGLSFDLKIGQDGYFPGVLEPLPSAIPILFYPDGQVAGVRIDGPTKLVVLAFCINDLEVLDARKMLLQRILSWFNQE